MTVADQAAKILHPSEPRTVLFVSIGFTGIGLSGGDIAWLKLAIRLLSEGRNIVVFTSEDGKTAFTKYGLTNAEYVLVDSGRRFRPPNGLLAIFESARRGLVASLKLRNFCIPRDGLVIGSSDLLHEVLPLACIGENSHTIIASIFHMVYPISRVHSKLARGDNLASRMIMHLQQLVSIYIVKRSCDFVIAHLNTVEPLIRMGVQPSRIMPFPLQLVNVEQERTPPSSGRPKFDAYWVGRYSRRKGFEDALAIWKEVQRARPQSSLAIIGGVANNSYAMKLLAHSNLRNVEVFGFLPESEKRNVMKNCRVLLHTSYFEGVPTTAWEAMACGVPIVCYDFPFNDGLKGVIRVSATNLAAFAGACLRVLDDPSVYSELKKNLSTYVQREDAQTFKDTVLQAYLRARGNTQSPQTPEHSGRSGSPT